jgi:hypothetical protein
MKHDAYFDNPYKYMNIEERAYVAKTGEEITANVQTGELFVMKKIAGNKVVMHDSRVYTKIFQESVHQLCTLSTGSWRIFMYALATIKPLSETVVLNSPDVMLFCNIGKTSFYDGIIELLDKKILCKKLGSSIEFWFDPNIFFNGNRVKMVK